MLGYRECRCPSPAPLSISCWAPGDWSESDRRWGRAGRGRAHCSSERPKGESGAALRPQDGGLPAGPQPRVSTSGPERLQPGPLCAGCGPRARAWPGRAVAWPLCGQLPGAATAHRWTRTLCPPGGSVCTRIDPPHAPPGLLLSPVLQMGKLRPGGQQVLSQVRSQGLRSDHLVLKPHVLCSPPAGPGPRCEAWAGDPAVRFGLGLLPRPARLPAGTAAPALGPCGRAGSACSWPRNGELLGGTVVRNGLLVQCLLPVMSGDRVRVAHFQVETPISPPRCRRPTRPLGRWHCFICAFQPSVEEQENPRKSAGPRR